MTREEALLKIGELVIYARTQGWDDVYTDAFKTLEHEPCEDAISRAEVLDEINRLGLDAFENYAYYSNLFDFVSTLPSVQQKQLYDSCGTTKEQLQKTGHWIMIDKELQRYKCSECGEVIRLHKKSEIPKLEKDETLFNYRLVIAVVECLSHEKGAIRDEMSKMSILRAENKLRHRNNQV